MGRKAHEPTDNLRKRVQKLAGYGFNQQDIAKNVGMGINTLRKYYKDELDLGKIEADQAVIENLWKIATGSSPQAAIACMYWTKARCGWRDTQTVEISGRDGNAIEHVKMEMTAEQAAAQYESSLGATKTTYQN